MFKFGIKTKQHRGLRSFSQGVNDTVAQYLNNRLKILEVKRIFGIPGNYTAGFLNTILEDQKLGNANAIQLTTMPNEMLAGYAADGYARVQGLKGLGVVHVTYGVGAMTLLNATANSFVERVPIIIINGAPTNKEFRNKKFLNLQFQHLDHDPQSNIEVFRQYTSTSHIVTSAYTAAYQIEDAVHKSILTRQPVYLEFREDVWRAQAHIPEELRHPLGIEEILAKEKAGIKTQLDTNAAVDKTIEILTKYKAGSSAPTFWAGIEIQRYDLQKDFLDLLDSTDYKFITDSFSKSVIEEDHPRFVSKGRQNLIKEDDVVIALGVATTGAALGVNGGNLMLQENKVFLQGQGAFIGGQFYSHVPLGQYMRQLKVALKEANLQKEKNNWKERACKILSRNEEPPKPALDPSTKLSQSNFFDSLNANWVCNDKSVSCVVDVSFPLINAETRLKILSRNSFVSNANWLAIGFSTPAAVGVKAVLADKAKELGDKRVIVVTGDGAFQETCAATSTMAKLNQNSVVFIMNNQLYGYEQLSVSPQPFRKEKLTYDTVDPKNPFTDPKLNDRKQIQKELLGEMYSYNVLEKWNYEKWTEVLGKGTALRVETIGELEKAISKIKADPNGFYIVNVVLPITDSPYTEDDLAKNLGEDEIIRANWPPEQF